MNTNHQNALNSVIPDTEIKTWSGRTQESKNRDIVHLKDFGCIPNDPNFDNSSKIKNALESGFFINFGDSKNTYYISNTVSINLNSDIFVISGGAKIVVNSIADLKYAITINCNGFNVGTLGKIVVDSQLKSFSGLHVSNTNGNISEVLLNQINSLNCRRSSTQHTGGDGIYIVGNVDPVILNEPRVIGVHMAKDAGVLGSQGISGIAITRSIEDINYIPRQIVINNPHIEDISSEDLDYYADQDGIKVFTRHSQPVVLPNNTTVVVNNPYFKNCLGRAFKSQAEIVVVNNPVVYRDKGFNRGYGNPEFDFQTGGGKVVNGYAVYKNTRPISLFYFYGSENEVKNKGLQVGSVDGFNVSVEYDTPTVQDTELVRTMFYDGCDDQKINIKGINVRGVNFSLKSFLQISRNGVTPKNIDFVVEDCAVPMTQDGSIFIAQDAFENNNLNADLVRFKNTLNNRVNVTISRKQNFSNINVVDSHGLLTAVVGNGSLPVNFINGAQEYGEFPLKGDRRGGGNMRAGKYRLVTGENRIQIGGFSTVASVIMTISKSYQSVMFLAISNGGIRNMGADSTEISIGGTAPSAIPKLFDVYVNNGDLIINNTYGITFLTMQMIG